jgi:hypothetical protein
MSSQAPPKLSLLRDIGWSRWDPIGLNGAEGGWQNSNAADEYDRYMLRVAGGLQSDEPDGALVDYLVSIETRHMGLPDSLEARTRAETTVAAIRKQMQRTR